MPCFLPRWPLSPVLLSVWLLKFVIYKEPRCWKRKSFSLLAKKGQVPCRTSANPILTENLTGLARMVRAYAAPAMENVALWHERDISHSSVERMIGPDATITLDFALQRMTMVIEKLIVYPQRMLENMDKLGGLMHSQRVLLALTQAGVSREESYKLVQRNAMKVWEERKDFLTELKNDEDVMKALLDRRARGQIRSGLPHQTCQYDFCSGVWPGLISALPPLASISTLDLPNKQ